MLEQYPNNRPGMPGRKESSVFTSRVRAAVLGLFALLLASSLAPVAASAQAGPFWHHRANAKEGAGAKVEANSPETFHGEGGEQKLKGQIGETPVEGVAKSMQIKGIIYNNALQGQVKLTMVYNQPELVKPALKGCATTVGANNVISVLGHLGWKWDGTAKQLTEPPPLLQKPDGLGTPGEIQEGATKLPEGAFTTIALKGAGCGVLAGKYPINGSVALEGTPENLEEWSTAITIKLTEGKKKQHFWNGKEFIGVETELKSAGHEANVSGEAKAKSDVQEISAFEK